MCLSIPSKVVKIDENNVATVETLGVYRQVSLDLMSEPVDIGDYILIHVGVAMGKINKEDALESLAIYEEIAKQMETGEINETEGDLGLLNELNRRV